MEYFKNITKRLGSEFDGYIYESEAGIIGKKMVLENTPAIFTESEGAVVYIPEETKKYINTAVFINSQGNPTYEAKDLGLLDLKFEKYNPDLSIFITDHQQISHFAVVLDAVEKINKSWVERSIHRTHGRMTFKGQKMSSRLGGVPLVADILETVLAEVFERTKNRDTVDTRENPEAIAVGALKFAILRAQAGKNIDFDPETSLSFEGDSGPYLQYTGVRANSVLEKAGKISAEIFPATTFSDTPTTDVEKILARFPEVVENSINNWAPHYVTTYLCELAQSFNSWYAHTQIIDEANPNMNYNLAITKSVAQVMQNGLYLLGITLPERM
ncbi:MAG: arginine--tRNA ligase [Candidatus Nomurabacteria bacterium]|nr:arginine--tRNA ligase [Candidatus Nomurabacteria bacterium]